MKLQMARWVRPDGPPRAQPQKTRHWNDQARAMGRPDTMVGPGLRPHPRHGHDPIFAPARRSPTTCHQPNYAAYEY
jgi:hypothetical protein